METVSPPKQVLSKNVMNMKFMKRKEETNVQSKEDASKRRRLLDNSAGATGMDVEVALAAPTPPHDRSAALVCTIEATDLYSALPGRRSFGGFNKVIERNYAILMDQQPGDLVPATADEEQILRQYESLVSLPRGPGQGKGKGKGKREGGQEGGQASGPDKQPRKEGGKGGKGGGGRPDNNTDSNPYLPSKFSSSKKQKGGNKA